MLAVGALLSVLGLVCVLAVTAIYATNIYKRHEEVLMRYIEEAVSYVEDRVNKSEEEFLEACGLYAKSADTGLLLDLQLVNPSGRIEASSQGKLDQQMPDTPEIAKAMNSRGLQTYIGEEPLTQNHVMTISTPLIATSGNVIGVFRLSSDCELLDRQIALVSAVTLLVVILLIVVFMFCLRYIIKSTQRALSQITEKARMIAGGSYGIQIQAKYDGQVGQLAQTINEMSLTINQNEKTQTEFISSLSHELRTPLTAITGWSETLLHSDDLDEGTRRGMKIIHREAGRLTEMVISLLDFTRIQDGRMTLNIEPTDLRSEFEDTVFMYGSRLEADGIHLEYIENEDEIPEIACDPQRMRQVFLNILDNASKHGGDGKRIDAEICCIEDDVAVRIRDYGPGIPEDEIPLVKRKFYKGSSKARGSGIGLAVCDEIVQMHGGQLILENAPDGGTLVTIQLPISQ